MTRNQLIFAISDHELQLWDIRDEVLNEEREEREAQEG